MVEDSDPMIRVESKPHQEGLIGMKLLPWRPPYLIFLDSEKHFITFVKWTILLGPPVAASVTGFSPLLFSS